MVYYKELIARIKTDFHFSWQEISALLVAIVVTGFVFSFRDWGGAEFDAATGLGNLILLIVVAAISFSFRLSCQKIYGLVEAHKVEFRVWWLGMLLALVIAFVSRGYIPLVLLGVATVGFMVRQRLGEFRYGFSYWVNGVISYWGVMGSLILAILFAIGAFFYPESYFFTKGVSLNLIMAACSLIPIPQLEGLNIFFGSRKLYFFGIFLVLLAFVLLWLTRTAFGLIFAIIAGIVYAAVYLAIGSEK